MVKAKLSENIAFIPAITGAVISIFFIRSGFAALFFLLPLGFIGYGWGPKTLWSGLVFAIIGNSLLTLMIGLSFRVPGGDMAWEMLFYISMTAAFSWIILPLDEKSSGFSGAFRLAAGALVCNLVLMGLFTKTFRDPGFQELLNSQIEVIASIYRMGSTADAVAGSLEIDRIMDLLWNFIMRGGSLFTALLVLFMNRQLSITLIRFFGGPRRDKVFSKFHVHPQIIWLLLFSVLLILVCNIFGWTMFGIILSNIMTLCCLMYMAQGLGIIQFLTLKPGFPAVLRFLIPIIFVLLLFSPVINFLLLGSIIILGITENWVFLRGVSKKRPASTPEL